MKRIPACVIALLLALTSTPGSARTGDLRDLYFGEALYHANQGYYFDALERLDAELGQHYGLDEPELDSLHFHIKQAEFFVGDFELNYRMHHRAGRAIRAVLGFLGGSAGSSGRPATGGIHCCCARRRRLSRGSQISAFASCWWTKGN